MRGPTRLIDSYNTHVKLDIYSLKNIAIDKITGCALRLALYHSLWGVVLSLNNFSLYRTTDASI